MTGPYKRKKHHTGDTFYKRKYRTRHRVKDLDEIDVDLRDGNREKLLNQEIDADKPGEGQFYCLHCSRYFIDDTTLNEHFRTKGHKRQLKRLVEEPYSIEDSLRAAGQGSLVRPQLRDIQGQNEEDQ